jgi:hypothetical protein
VNWSPPYLLFDTTHHLGLRYRAGVYRIRAFKNDDEPVLIKRFAGTDPLGILHIGKSNDLGTRIRTFRQAAQGLKAQHHAGVEYFRWQYERLVPHSKLKYDYYMTQSERDALELEQALHEDYRMKFLDRPPLDSTSGQTAE